MKSNEFAKVLRSVDVLLQSACKEGIARPITMIGDVLTHAGTKQVNATLKLLDGAAFERVGPFQSNKLGEAVGQLAAIRDFAKLNCKKSTTDDLERILKFCETHRDVDAATFGEVAKVALTPKPRTSSKPRVPSATDEDVANYLQRLDETFGFEPEFDRVFSELKSDASMKAPQLKKLAKLFTKLAAKSGPDALKSIYRRHSNILDADRHKAAVGGRVG